jgi:CheY-like chemotaxis protein
MLVALTGWGQEQDIAQSHAAGFDRHLVKPVEAAALEKLLVEAAAAAARPQAGSPALG